MSDTPSHGPSRTTTIALIALLCLIWGSTWVVIRDGLTDLPPFTAAAARFVVAAIGMAIVAKALGARETGKSPPARLWIALGLCNFACSYAIVYRTETILPSALVALLWGVFPMLSAIAGHMFLPSERLRLTHWAGFTLGFGGLALLFAKDLPQLGPEAVPAAAVLLLSPTVSTVGNTLVKRSGGGVRSLELNRNAMAFGAVLLCALAFTTEDVASVAWTPRAILTVTYLSLVGTVLTFGLYFWLMRYVRANTMSLISYVTPMVAMLLGVLYGETLTVWTAAGAACILGGVALAVRK
ncbi:MAG: EamA family transporter [Planctomycetota bacterium]|nr:EamA family transporter [Planctomycetota bacterium]